MRLLFALPPSPPQRCDGQVRVRSKVRSKLSSWGLPALGRPLLLMVLLLAGAKATEAQERRVLGHEAYEMWRTIGTQAISPSGDWVLYTLEYENADGELVFTAPDSGREIRIPRGSQPVFARQAGFALFTIRPTREAQEAARGARSGNAGTSANGVLPDTLGILSLSTGEVTKVPDVQSWRLAADDGRFVAYHLRPQASQAPGAGEPTRHGTMVLRSLETGAEARFPAATAYSWAQGGSRLALVDSIAGEENSIRVQVVHVASGEATTVASGTAAIRNLVLTESGDQLAFLRGNRSEGDPGEGLSWELLHWRLGTTSAQPVASKGTSGIPAGWAVSENASPSFSEDGGRLFFGTVPPAPAPAALSPLEARVDVEIWHWLDSELMSVQNNRVAQERRRSYQAVLHLGTGRVVQLADPSLPQVNVALGGRAPFALGRDTGIYGIEGSWESPNFSDIYRIDVNTGARTLLLERTQAMPSVSPGGRFLTWYEPGDSTWYAQDVSGGPARNLSVALPHPVWNVRNDTPSPANSWGSAGWIEGDRALLLYDQFDLWAVDPTGRTAPRNLTAGAGREANLRYRIVRLDRDSGALAPNAEVLLSTFDDQTKAAGFSRLRLDRPGAPDPLLFEDRRFSTPVRAADAPRILFTQQTFVDFPDLWVAGEDFSGRTRVSHANPQQADYRWGTAELVDWLSADGIPLQGILMKPDDFDPSRQYPLVVYFYERWSDGFHDHYTPVPHRSRIAFPLYTSDDYLVFIPDIVYLEGYPGEGALNAVNPGIFKLLEQGFVDRDRIALQGHSWGGYQIAFMVTRSRNLYRAAAAGAPVANMTSAYGGLRRETGVVRQFQYERTQSRIGGTLWEMPIRYIENSPLFWADKIETPLLIMHNDNDGAVPWEQGIELFVALRRLGKPAWMVNYRGEPHWPTTFPNRVDWNVRMKQFFDHYLKDAPPPAWMVEGIPALRRGETLGYDLVDGASANEDRYRGRR
jgi:dipeptidyl aminopeptidase/acylaminoacyl peptidase